MLPTLHAQGRHRRMVGGDRRSTQRVLAKQGLAQVASWALIDPRRIEPPFRRASEKGRLAWDATSANPQRALIAGTTWEHATNSSPEFLTMGKRQISFRVPDDLRDWLASAVPTGASQQQFLLSVLRAARSGEVRPTLFDELGRAPVTPPPARLPFTFIDLFAGIGGFRIGLSRVGGKCVFTSEWNKYAQQTYRAWFGEEESIHGDITTIDIDKDIPSHDILAAGFPCQPFSIAGVSKKNALGRKHGFDDETQGNLFFKICDIVRVKRPPVLFLENVKNLL